MRDFPHDCGMVDTHVYCNTRCSSQTQKTPEIVASNVKESHDRCVKSISKNQQILPTNTLVEFEQIYGDCIMAKRISKKKINKIFTIGETV